MPDATPATDFTLTMPLGPNAGLTQTAHANRDKIVAAYQGLIAGKQDALAVLLDPDIRFYEADSLPYGVTAHGIEATLAGVGGMLANWTKIDVVVEEALAAGDLICLYMTFKGVAVATGKIYEGVCAEMFRFKDGKIIEWRPIYWDTHAVRVVSGAA